MKLYRTILMASDLSPTSDDAFEEALRLAKEVGAELRILYVYEPPMPVALPYPTAGLYDTFEQETQIREAAARTLERLIRRASDRGVQATPLLRQGVPDYEITEAAARERADLIILGTHGRRGTSRLLLGSVAARVVADAPCPVLTIRPRAAAHSVAV